MADARRGRDPLRLRSKVARRLLGLFLACALLPIAVLAASTFLGVSQGLREQSEQRVHQASKAAGMLILDRLLGLGVILGETGRSPDPAAAWSGFVPRPGEVGTLIEAVTLLRADGARRPLLGPPIAIDADVSGVRDGEIRLILSTRGPSPELVLVEPLGSGGALLAELSAGALFAQAIPNALPPKAEYCVVAGDAVLACSRDALESLVPVVDRVAAGGHTGSLEARAGGEAWFVGYWTLFLGASFGTDSWTVVVAEPRASALAVLGEFRTAFPVAALACFGVVFLASVAQIRRRMDPLDRLRDATRRVGDGRFDVAVEVASDDEFRDLANAFNGMTHRLAEHFQLLERLIALDREILSSADERSVARALLAGLPDLHPCDEVAVCLMRDGTPPRLTGHLGVPGSGTRSFPITCEPGETELRALEQAPGGVLDVDLDGEPSRLLAPLAERGARSARLLPLRGAEGLLGLVALARREPSGTLPDASVVRQVADQAAVAIANARTAERNRFLAQRDALTGLANRIVFFDRLEQALVTAQRGPFDLAVLLLDLDRFKDVNDTFGHVAGDRLLQLVAQRLGQTLRAGTLARLGGDEFAILLPAPSDVDVCTAVARRVLETLERPIELAEGGEVFVSGSVGIAVHPLDGADAGSLLQHADAAMYQAKAAGGGRFAFYTRELGERAQRRLAVEAALRRALERDEIEVHYQPVVDAESREWIGFEALSRWTSPELGQVKPTEFVPIAEETGLIVPLGERVLERACRQVREWQLRHRRALHVAVNVARRQLRDRGLAARVARILAATGLAPGALTLELTESELMEQQAAGWETLRELRDLGIRISIDDFGTGYSSLGYLHDAPVDILKIDRCFVEGIEEEGADDVIARAVVGLGHALNLTVLAEGVEREEQLQVLRRLGCDLMQGWLFAPALSSDEVEKRLAAWSGPDPIG